MITPLYAVSDVHGHRTAMRAALRDAGLASEDGRWTGGEARLWFLGDYVDRGPDGIGVIDDIRQLAEDAAAEGGHVGALLGNHEAQLLAAHRFRDQPVPGWDEPGGFLGAWRRWGGLQADLDRLSADHRAWIGGLPAMAVEDGYLLVHSDTDAYLRYGSAVGEINTRVMLELAGDDPEAFLYFAGVLSDRGPFYGSDGERRARHMLRELGAGHIVHGHTTLQNLFGLPSEQVTEPIRHAGGLATAIDGGAYKGGKILVARLTPLPAPVH
ncbi:metallophosphoesterase [Longispora albida]|uniref:metallophosphoesterase n=1 Tax=Longispora albida TaxID=203523 RepID=UPI0012F76D56|nr:metallophosphoesterase [Longispora albida]